MTEVEDWIPGQARNDGAGVGSQLTVFPSFGWQLMADRAHRKQPFLDGHRLE
jgi:hypothetical protein